MTKKHKCRFAKVAPQALHDAEDVSEPVWEWCIRCGKLRLGELTFTPGPKQKLCLVEDLAS